MVILVLLIFLGSVSLASIFGTLAYVRKKDASKLRLNLILSGVFVAIFIVTFFYIGYSSDNGSSTGESATISSLKREVSSLKTDSKGAGSEGEGEESSESSNSGDNSRKGKLGETIEFTSGEKVTVSNVVDDPSAHVNDMPAGENPVVVTVTVENTKSTPLEFNAQRFSLYDGNDVAGDFNSGTYHADIPDDIAAGKKATIQITFGAKAKGPYSVSYGDFTWEQ